LQAGELRLSTNVFYDVVVAPSGCVQLRLLPGQTQNKKVAPGAVLHTFAGGRVDPKTSAGPGFSWEFKKGHELVVARGSKGVRVMKLLTYVQENKCTSVYQHNRFEAGIFPPELALKQAMTFVPGAPASAVFQKVLEAIRASTQAHLLWEVVTKEGRVWPEALLLVSKKQLTLKVGESLQL